MSTPPQTQSPLNLYGLTRAEVRALVTGWDLSSVHAARLWNYLYYACVDSFDAMPDLPARLHDRLRGETTLGHLPVALETRSRDGFTRKYLLALPDAEKIETVLMRFTGRVTACISSQAGCAMGCVFCATGQRGFTRHLTTGEIVAQALHVQRVLRALPSLPADADGDGPNGTGAVANETGSGASALAAPAAKPPPERLRNVVLMGMGEPLHNYDAVMKAVDVLRDGNGLALGAKKITLSTVGVVPGIVRMADEARPIHLAVSLHAATQEERAALVPVAKRWPLDALMEACRYYIRKRERRIFFEWTLIEGKNDSAEQAHAVGNLLRGLDAQVNLIPLNPTEGYAGLPSRSEAAKRFQAVLAEYDLPSTVRQRRGIDIAAGCGQLAAASERE